MAIVAISRGTFSGGLALADCVAGRLGYPLISREEIVASSTWYGIPEEMLSASSQEGASFWQRLNRERQAYINGFRPALCERAKGGNLVYHGHVAHLLLPGVSHVLKVRVIADMEFRIRALMQERNLGREESQAYIARVDAERVEWTRFLYGVEWDDTSLFDVVLNLSHISVDGACETVAHMAQLDEFRPTPQSMRAMEDLALSSRISAALWRDPAFADSSLEVTARDGVVTIGGTGSRDVIDSLPSLVAQEEGVRSVNYEITPV